MRAFGTRYAGETATEVVPPSQQIMGPPCGPSARWPALRRLDVVAAQVVEVERPHRLADLALPRLGDVVDVRAQLDDVRLGRVHVADRCLCGRQGLHELPEELDVEV